MEDTNPLKRKAEDAEPLREATEAEGDDDEFDDSWADAPVAAVKKPVVLTATSSSTSVAPEGDAPTQQASSSSSAKAGLPVTDDDDAPLSEYVKGGDSKVKELGQGASAPSSKSPNEKKKVEYDPFRIFVANLSFAVQEDQLELDFEECGEISDIKLLEQRGLAFIQYATTEGAAKALKLDGDEYWGRVIAVQYATPKGSVHGEKRNEDFDVFIKGISASTTEDALRAHFSACGEVESLRIPKTLQGEAKGVAFITFTTQDAVSKAVEMNEQKLGDLVLIVEKSSRGDKGKGKGKGKNKDGKGKGKGKGKDKGKGKGKGKSKGKK